MLRWCRSKWKFDFCVEDYTDIDFIKIIKNEKLQLSINLQIILDNPF